MIKEKPCSLKIFTDGASRGNPGNAAIAFSIEDGKGNILKQHSEPIGVTTNNVAEYSAMIKALKRATYYCKGQIHCFSDSEFMVDQLIGKDKIKKKHIKELFLKVKELENKFKRVTYSHLSREHPKIRKVDRLANKALDKLE